MKELKVTTCCLLIVLFHPYDTLAKLWINESTVFPVKESDNYKCRLSNKEIKKVINFIAQSRFDVINKWTSHFGLVNTHYQPTEQEKIVLKQEKKSRELEIKREKLKEKKIIRETNLRIGDKKWNIFI